MDLSPLESASAELAAYLSEVTHGDLGTAVGRDGGSIADLLVRIIERNLHVTASLAGTVDPAPVDRATLLAPADTWGTGYELAYRRAAADAQAALIAAPADARAEEACAVLLRATEAETGRLRATLELG